MMKLCISTGIVTFIIVLYCCIGVDFSTKIFNEDIIDHPLFRFFVLGMMAVVFCYDHYIALLIGFAYMLTKYEFLDKNSYYKKEKKVITYVDNYTPTIKNIAEKVVPLNITKKTFTTKSQFNDVQSNIISDLDTEVRVWDEGYGVSGGFK